MFKENIKALKDWRRAVSGRKLVFWNTSLESGNCLCGVILIRNNDGTDKEIQYMTFAKISPNKFRGKCKVSRIALRYVDCADSELKRRIDRALYSPNVGDGDPASRLHQEADDRALWPLVSLEKLDKELDEIAADIAIYHQMKNLSIK
jgi:hypothetical protein